MTARGVVSAVLLVALASAVWAAGAPRPPPMKDVPRDMRPYFLSFLVAGPKYVAGESPEHTALLPKHLAFIRKMVGERKLVFAGPFADEGRLFGMAIVAAPSLEQAREWMDQDPAVQAGFFAHEIHPVLLPSLDTLRVRY